MRKSLLVLGVVAASLMMAVGCTPATQFNKGVEMSFHPSGKADAQQKIVSSAIELKQDSDQTTIKEQGGIYLGELEVVAAKNSDFASGGGGAKAGLSGRVSLEAANRGATHFYLASSNTEHSVQQASGPHVGIGGNSSEQVAKINARFVLYRVEQEKWAALPKPYQPEAMPGAPTTTAATPAPEAKAADPAAVKPADKPAETAAPPKK